MQNSKPQLPPAPRLRRAGKTKNSLNQTQQEQLLKIARTTLISYLKDKTIPELKIEDEGLRKPLGAFVTLTKNKNLRGCIGEFADSKPLWQVVQEKAIESASDPRFSPVQLNELEEIKIEISVLSRPERITDWRKIVLGKHGVIIRQGFQTGTFLPQVAQETGWDLKTFLSTLCTHKAGLPAQAYQDKQTKIYVFTAQVFSE